MKSDQIQVLEHTCQLCWGDADTSRFWDVSLGRRIILECDGGVRDVASDDVTAPFVQGNASACLRCNPGLREWTLLVLVENACPTPPAARSRPTSDLPWPVELPSQCHGKPESESSTRVVTTFRAYVLCMMRFPRAWRGVSVTVGGVSGGE
jgi:hypothetical protein